MSGEQEYNYICDRPDKITWLDPCAGGDATHDMSYPSVINEIADSAVVETIDERGDSLANIKGDYLKMEVLKGAYDVIITNPPFLLAEQFIRKALGDVRDGGYVVMLLRLNFFGSKARRAFFDEFMPERVYVHHRRMSFTDDGKTDSVEEGDKARIYKAKNYLMNNKNINQLLK